MYRPESPFSSPSSILAGTTSKNAGDTSLKSGAHSVFLINDQSIGAVMPSRRSRGLAGGDRGVLGTTRTARPLRFVASSRRARRDAFDART